ncbi:MAG: peptidase [Planctomycetota bacterium]|nr:MAG: peptidase [Planctomycetota bacterium]
MIFKTLKRKLKENTAHITVVLLTICFILIYCWNDIFIVIRSGEAGVHYKKFFGGTVTDKVYGEGMAYIYPWDDLFIYNIRVQEEKIQINVLSKEGLKIGLKISIRFQPEADLVGVLHKEVGPEYLHKVVIPEVEAVVRETVSKFTADELYTTKHMIPKQIINDSVEQVVRNYVKVQDVVIRDIILPENIRKAIEDKLAQKHIAEAYVYKLLREEQEKKRKIIEAEGYNKYHEIISKTLNANIIQWEGIKATEKLSESNNTKVILIGNGPKGLPVIMNAGGH